MNKVWPFDRHGVCHGITAADGLSDGDLAPWVDHGYLATSYGITLISHEGLSRGSGGLPDVVLTCGRTFARGYRLQQPSAQRHRGLTADGLGIRADGSSQVSGIGKIAQPMNVSSWSIAPFRPPSQGTAPPPHGP